MILIVDDDPDFAENCSMLLEAYGYEVTVASSGTEALEKVSLLSLELLISDCSMPGMTGLDLSKRIKTEKTTCLAPVILMSGSLEREVAHGNSYDAFMRKPFLAEHLLSQVKKLLSHNIGNATA
ncbi:hypothetical protein GCM10011396_23830 [Undibacterium terreum]|uniref:Response regulatory domain-containing protein n=2 Tax=Undibacterium terreum TaxID=1224302 RepID=A0A916XJG7_9BURK|nr:hypothetical protein GCM10011396_23830 [Undibacterium terreum]